jgi:hypothetical protein
MYMMYNEIMKILSMEIFSKFAAGGVIQVAEINAAIALLLSTNIPFEIVFSPSNRMFAKQVVLTVYITPTITIAFSIQFEGGAIAL